MRADTESDRTIRERALEAVAGRFAGLLVFALGTAMVYPAACQAQDPLAPALEKYESTAVKVAREGTVFERVQALRGLVAVASPRYTVVRDLVAAGPSKLEKVATLESIVAMGDDSPEGVAIAERLLGDDDDEVMSRATFVVRDLGLRVRFEKLWRRDALPRVLRPAAAHYGLSLDQVDGIGAAKPWNDPAWKELTEERRLGLLSRAGTREALALVIPSDRAKDPPYLTYRAEAVDLAFLRELRDDPRAAVRAYAWKSLGFARDLEHQKVVKLCLWDAFEGTSSGTGCKREDLAALGFWMDLGQLDPDSLRLAAREPKVFTLIAEELKKRGQAFTYDELSGGVVLPKPNWPGPLPAPAPQSDDATYALWNHFQRITALVHERRYDDVASEIERAVTQPDGPYWIETINRFMWESPEFLAMMPEEIAHRCYVAVRTAVDKGANFQRTLGMVARGDDAEQIWRELRESKNPLDDAAHFGPVLWGATRRSADVRQLLASVGYRGWGNVFPQPPPRKSASEAVPSAVCGQGGIWNPVGVPTYPSTLAAPARELAAALAPAFRKGAPSIVSNAFLSLRSDPADPLAALADRREAVRRHALIAFDDRLPPGFAHPTGFIVAESSRWLALERYQLGKGAGSVVTLPGPALDDSGRKWIEERSKEGRSRVLKQTLDGFQNVRDELFEHGYGNRPTKVYAQLPSERLLALGPDFIEDVRSLLSSDELAIRHAAAWAIWLWMREDASARVWLKDAASPEASVRISALAALQAARYEPASALFPPLLREQDPALRQVGLWGIRSFRIAAASPDVESLLVDENDAIAETAIEVLGDMAPPEAKTLMVELLFDARTRVAWKAAAVLPKIADRKTLDQLVARLGDAATTDADRRAIFAVLARATCDPAYSYYDWEGIPNAARAPELTRRWQEWWALHKDEMPARWYMAHLERHIKVFLEDAPPDPDWAQARGAVATIQAIRSAVANATPTEKDKTLVAEWWRHARRYDPWDIISYYGGIPKESLDLAQILFPERVRRQLLAPLTAWPPQRYAASSWHALLVKNTGVDFGDPTPVLCDELQARIVEDWVRWAREKNLLK